jgi:hypothetical protein
MALPATLPFWLAVGHESAGRTVLSWSPSSMRGRDVTLVVMNATGAPRVTAGLTATVYPRWISPTTWALFILGIVLFVVGSAALLWRRNRDIVYVVEPAQLPRIAARLGMESRTGGGPATGAGRWSPSGGAAPAPWFARVGGRLAHASSVAPTGRRHTHLPPAPPAVSLAAPSVLPTAAELPVQTDERAGQPDPSPRAWPPVQPDHVTPAVTPAVPPASLLAEGLLLPGWLSSDSDLAEAGIGGEAEERSVDDASPRRPDRLVGAS